MYGDVKLEVHAVGADVRQDALQALVFDAFLVFPGVVFLDGDRHRDAQKDDGKLDNVVEARCAYSFSLAWTWRQSRVACCELKNPV